MYRLEQRQSLQKQIPENPTASQAERLSVYRLTYRQSPQQLGGPTGDVRLVSTQHNKGKRQYHKWAA